VERPVAKATILPSYPPRQADSNRQWTLPDREAWTSCSSTLPDEKTIEPDRHLMRTTSSRPPLPPLVEWDILSLHTGRHAALVGMPFEVDE
jgi:hypothetical protein